MNKKQVMTDGIYRVRNNNFQVLEIILTLITAVILYQTHDILSDIVVISVCMITVILDGLCWFANRLINDHTV